MAGRSDEDEVAPFDTGRKGYREPGAPADERPMIVYTDYRKSYRRERGRIFEVGESPSSWSDDRREEERWMKSARTVLSEADAEEMPLDQKLQLIADVAGHRIKVRPEKKEFPPRKPLSPEVYHKRMTELRAQAGGMSSARSVPSDARLPYREPGED